MNQVKSNRMDILRNANLGSRKSEKSKIDLHNSTKSSYHF